MIDRGGRGGGFDRGGGFGREGGLKERDETWTGIRDPRWGRSVFFFSQKGSSEVSLVVAS